MDRRLYEASLGGNVTSLLELLGEDPLVLERVITISSETPLHIAALYGHVDFAKEIINHKPELAFEFTSQGFSPLHLASTRKNVEMVKVLLGANPDVCSLKDDDGRTPLHLAAMKGRVENMEVLIQTCPEAVQQVLLSRKETILHLCINHNRLEALKLLVQSLRNSATEESISVNSRDDDGNTILHLAVAKKQTEIIRYLTTNSDIFGLEVNALNKNNFTALDVLAQSVRDLKDIEIGDLLRSAGVLKAKEHVEASNHLDHVVVEIKQPWHAKEIKCKKISKYHDIDQYHHWLRKKKTLLIVVASLIATMSFQAGLYPPGGVWQDDYSNYSSTRTGFISPTPFPPPMLYIPAGTSILGINNPILYLVYMTCNTVGFLASLSIILLLVSGLPLKQRFFFWVLMAVICVAITGMGLTYFVALSSMIPPADFRYGGRTAYTVLYGSLLTWLLVMGLVFFLHMFRFVLWLLRKWGMTKRESKQKEQKAELINEE